MWKVHLMHFQTETNGHICEKRKNKCLMAKKCNPIAKWWPTNKKDNAPETWLVVLNKVIFQRTIIWCVIFSFVGWYSPGTTLKVSINLLY